MPHIWFLADLVEVYADGEHTRARDGRPARRPAAPARPRGERRGLLPARGRGDASGPATPSGRLGPGDFVLGAEGRPAHLPRDERDAGALDRDLLDGRVRRVRAGVRRPGGAARAARAGGARRRAPRPPGRRARHHLLGPPGMLPADLARYARRQQLRPQVQQPRQRQADDVEVVALDPRDERRAAALDGVAAGAALPLAGGDVPVERGRVERAEVDRRSRRRPAT